MGLFGGGGSSSSSSTTNNTDSRISQQSGQAISGNGNTVLDGNAINQAFEFSRTALQQSLAFVSGANAAATGSVNASNALVSKAYDDGRGNGSMTEYLIFGGMALAGLVAVFALRSK